MLYIIDAEGAFMEDITALFGTLQEAIAAYGQVGDIRIIETQTAPRWPVPEYHWNGEGWTVPNNPGQAWDAEEGRWLSHPAYRRVLHERTNDDTAEALRKIREGDTRIDWQSWLSTLDAYNAAVSATVSQPTYPDAVVYPDYPTKP